MKIQDGLCECGCGLPTTLARDNDATVGYVKGQPLRFRKGHRLSHQRYKLQTHGDGVTATHIVIAESALGRRLPPQAQVHHVDGKTWNNAPSNLVICEDDAYHKFLHARTRIVKAGGNPNTQLICDKCGALKKREDFAKCQRQSSGRQTRCRECSIQTSRDRRARRTINAI